MRKMFPIIPDIFFNNLWTFFSLNHYESMNYIQAVRPSYFGLYDHVFGPNDPSKAKAKKRKMRKMKKLKK